MSGAAPDHGLQTNVPDGSLMVWRSLPDAELFIRTLYGRYNEDISGKSRTNAYPKNYRRIPMTRGRYPERALEKALKIAKTRGIARCYKRGPDMIADFSITNPECTAEVRIKRLRRIRFTLQWLGREAEDMIAGLLLIPSSKEISRELWICSPDYFWRFFRVCDGGLAELGRDGMPLPLKSPAPQPQPEISGNSVATGLSAMAGETLLSGTTTVPVSGKTALSFEVQSDDCSSQRKISAPIPEQDP